MSFLKLFLILGCIWHCYCNHEHINCQRIAIEVLCWKCTSALQDTSCCGLLGRYSSIDSDTPATSHCKACAINSNAQALRCCSQPAAINLLPMFHWLTWGHGRKSMHVFVENVIIFVTTTPIDIKPSMSSTWSVHMCVQNFAVVRCGV